MKLAIRVDAYKSLGTGHLLRSLALGTVSFGPTDKEKESRVFRRSLFVVRDMKAGETFTEENVRSIRPGDGLPPKHLKGILGRKAKEDISRGTPLSWDCIG